MYLVTGHSRHTSSKFKLKPGQFVVFAVQCGSFSYMSNASKYYFKEFLNINNFNKKVLYKEGQFVPNNMIKFLSTGKDTWLKGIFKLPLTQNQNNKFKTIGTNVNSLKKWFSTQNLKEIYTLKEIIGDTKGIFFVDVCRSINGISFEGNKIGMTKTNPVPHIMYYKRKNIPNNDKNRVKEAIIKKIRHNRQRNI